MQVPPCLTCHPQDTETHQTQRSFVDIARLYCASNSEAPRKQTKSDTVTRERHFPRGPAGPSPQSHSLLHQRRRRCPWTQLSSPRRPQVTRAPCTASALTALRPVSQRDSRGPCLLGKFNLNLVSRRFTGNMGTRGHIRRHHEMQSAQSRPWETQ